MKIEWLANNRVAALTFEEFLTLAKNNNVLDYKNKTCYENNAKEIVVKKCVFVVKGCSYKNYNLFVQLIATRPQEMDFLDDLTSSTRPHPVTLKDIFSIALRALICVDFEPESSHRNNIYCNFEIHNFINDIAALIIAYEETQLSHQNLSKLMEKLPHLKEKYLDEASDLEINIDTQKRKALLNLFGHVDAMSLENLLIQLTETAIYLLQLIRIQANTTLNETPEERTKLSDWATKNQEKLSRWIANKQFSSTSLVLDITYPHTPEDTRTSFSLKDRIYLLIKKTKESSVKDITDEIEKTFAYAFNKQDSVSSKLQALEDLFENLPPNIAKKTSLLREKYQEVLNEVAVIIKSAAHVEEVTWLLDELDIAKGHHLACDQKTNKIHDLMEHIKSIPYRYTTPQTRV